MAGEMVTSPFAEARLTCTLVPGGSGAERRMFTVSVLMPAVALSATQVTELVSETIRRSFGCSLSTTVTGTGGTATPL